MEVIKLSIKELKTLIKDIESETDADLKYTIDNLSGLKIYSKTNFNWIIFTTYVREFEKRGLK
jgi:hypothetical protein